MELKNLQIEKDTLVEKRTESSENLEKARKLLSDAESKNADVKSTLEKLKNDEASCSKKIAETELALARLKQIQIALKKLIFALKDFITVEEKEKTVLENLAETDFNSTEKRQAFLSYGEKAKNQNVLLIKDIGRKEEDSE